MSRRCSPLFSVLVIFGLATATPAAEAPAMKPNVAPTLSPTRLPLADPGARAGRAPAKATIALTCERVVILSTGSGRGTCSADPAAGTAKCDDGDGNMASAACPGCRRTSGSGACLIQ